MDHFRPIRPVKVYQQVLQQIKALAEAGQLRAGDRLPAERALAEQLNVSRNSVREAFSVLETLGLIENRLGEGKVILSTSFAVLTDLIAMAKARGGRLAQDIYEARLSMEPNLVVMAAARATEAHLSTIGQALVEIQVAFDAGCFDRQADLRFHMAIAQASDNLMMAQLFRLTYEIFWETFGDPEAIVLVVMLEQYQNLYQALIDRDAERASGAVRAYLTPYLWS